MNQVQEDSIRNLMSENEALRLKTKEYSDEINEIKMGTSGAIMKFEGHKKYLSKNKNWFFGVFNEWIDLAIKKVIGFI